MTVIFPSFCFTVLGSSGKNKTQNSAMSVSSIKAVVIVCNWCYSVKVSITSVTHDTVIVSGAVMCNWCYSVKVAITSVTHDTVIVSGAVMCDWCYNVKVAITSVTHDTVIVSGAVMVCDQRYNMKVAVQISAILGRRQRLMMLLLCMLFCNPRRSPKAEKKAANQYSVRYCTYGSDAACALIKS